MGSRFTIAGAPLQVDRKTALLKILVIACATQSIAHADCSNPRLYEAGFEGPDGLASFYSINPTTGQSTLIGSIGFERVSGMDTDPATNIIYAIGEKADGSDTPVLISINRITGAGTLSAGETITCTATGSATAGQYANMGHVTGNPLVGTPVTDTDPPHYFGVAVAIDIEKTTNGVQADLGPGPLIPAGAAVRG